MDNNQFDKDIKVTDEIDDNVSEKFYQNFAEQQKDLQAGTYQPEMETIAEQPSPVNSLNEPPVDVPCNQRVSNNPYQQPYNPPPNQPYHAGQPYNYPPSNGPHQQQSTYYNQPNNTYYGQQSHNAQFPYNPQQGNWNQPNQPPQRPQESSQEKAEKGILKKISSNVGLSLVFLMLISLGISAIIGGIIAGVSIATEYMGSSQNIFERLYDLFSDDTVMWIVQVVASLITYLISIMVFTKLLKTNVKSFFARPHNGMENTIKCSVVSVGVGEVGVLLTVVVLTAFYEIFNFYPTGPDFSVSMSEPIAVIAYLMFSCLIAPVFEEIIFRGFILGSLQRFGNVFAILASSLLFGLYHGNLGQAIFATMVGIVFAYISIKSRSIIPSIIGHAFFNMLNSLLSFATDFMSTELHTLLTAAVALVMVILTVVILVISRKDLKIKDNYRGGLTLSKRVMACIATPGMIIIFVLFMLEFAQSTFGF